MINKERRNVHQQNLEIDTLLGSQITPDLWQKFSLFYQNTYLKRSGTQGYLSPAFFEILGKSLPRLEQEGPTLAFRAKEERDLKMKKSKRLF